MDCMSEIFSEKVVKGTLELDINKAFDEFELQSALQSKIIRALIKNGVNED